MHKQAVVASIVGGVVGVALGLAIWLSQSTYQPQDAPSVPWAALLIGAFGAFIAPVLLPPKADIGDSHQQPPPVSRASDRLVVGPVVVRDRERYQRCSMHSANVSLGAFPLFAGVGITAISFLMILLTRAFVALLTAVGGGVVVLMGIAMLSGKKNLVLDRKANSLDSWETYLGSVRNHQHHSLSEVRAVVVKEYPPCDESSYTTYHVLVLPMGSEAITLECFFKMSKAKQLGEQLASFIGCPVKITRANQS
ncbi:MAG: hypothetical protein AAGJ46_21835 [Planctomycetota bacterium]